MDTLTRRDFLKLSSTLLAGSLARASIPNLGENNGQSNIIIILFDAMSASNMSLYGYPRETTPNLNKFADRATVFHRHYSAGNFTTPGTASMLTGMLPWTHRAFTTGGLVRAEMKNNNIFHLLGSGYYRLAFCQNPYADRLVSQFSDDVDRFLPLTAYSLRGNKLVSDKLRNDRYLASIAFEEFLFTLNADVMGSSLLGYIYKNIALGSILKHQEHPWYPRGVPQVEGFTPYINEDVYAGVSRELLNLHGVKEPVLAYFHLFSPHFPYKPGARYWKLFQDNYEPPAKPLHPFGFGMSEEDIKFKRMLYDQQVAHVDAEFGSLIERLDEAGVLGNSYIIITSDHGELFERGFFGHGGVLLYESAIHIPLLVSSPRQKTRKDVYAPTSNIDILPTLLSLAKKTAPVTTDGMLLPEFGGALDNKRPLFTLYAAENSAFMPLKKMAVSINKENNKLIGYFGYDGLDNGYEMYNLDEDFEELMNLAMGGGRTYLLLREELLDRLADVNRSFKK